MVRGVQFLGLVPAISIGVITWFFQIFILNRFVGFASFTRYELVALVLFVLGGVAAFVAELSLQNPDLTAIEISASLYRTFVNWCAFLLIINERLAITRQQIGSLFLVILNQGLWSAQHYIVLHH
jgi:hypothetical protein